MSDKNFVDKIEWSAVLTVAGIILLFSSAVIVTLIAPGYIDNTWVQPTSNFQVQMYEVADPNLYLSSLRTDSTELQAVYHLKKDYSLLAFKESAYVRFIAPNDLKQYITAPDEKTLKLTPRLLLLRAPQGDVAKEAAFLRRDLQTDWEKENPGWKEKELQKPGYEILELFEADGTEAFAVAATDRIIENWVDTDFEIVDPLQTESRHTEPGVIYVQNPTEYRLKTFKFGEKIGWKYDPQGEKINSLEELAQHPLGFKSRKELISMGEHLYAIEGCWYCHSDQTRTLVQDVVVNGTESYPAPPSSANEYIYQKITFPGTRRIGPDLSRVGVKRPSRDWHQAHFWSPKTASKGSIMPAFKHLFDADPVGTSKNITGIPNYKFEALFQYLMTKGTRITAPTEAWWIGKDPILTKEIIEGRREL